MIIDGWVSSWGEEMPLFAGEFGNPEDALTLPIEKVTLAAPENLPIVVGSHIFWLGSHFEGRRYDKRRMREAGGVCVSMSVKPEAAVAALYPDVKVLAMGFVCNGPDERMEHEHHRNVARDAAPKLGVLLEKLVDLLNF